MGTMPRCTLSKRTQLHMDFIRALMNHPEKSSQIKKKFYAIHEQSELELLHAHGHPNALLYAEIYSFPENVHKNRYTNIFPFDYNLVEVLNSPEGNYINASVISLPLTNAYTRDHAYIATQGPLETTVLDFWRMVYQRQVNLMVCLSPPEEHQKQKFSKYWHEEGQFMVPFSDGATLHVTHQWTETLHQPGKMLLAFLKQLQVGPRYQYHPNSIQVFSSLHAIQLRGFELKYRLPSYTAAASPLQEEEQIVIKENKVDRGGGGSSFPFASSFSAKTHSTTYTTTVYHLSTNAWPDHGVMPMDEFLALLEFTRFINCSIRLPLLVHCSYVDERRFFFLFSFSFERMGLRCCFFFFFFFF
ncbi:hypothetical protein HMI56_006275 [Coelomomyces lativittatus]|nr:hypothetical protein HMI56_006275 [Coelomomyces lativittatus]